MDKFKNVKFKKLNVRSMSSDVYLGTLDDALKKEFEGDIVVKKVYRELNKGIDGLTYNYFGGER